MRFLICNGSPHGDKGATAGYIKALETGIRGAGADVENVLLVKVREHAQFAEQAAAADLVIVAFPLYTDAMPGITMAFFEALEPYILHSRKIIAMNDSKT